MHSGDKFLFTFRATTCRAFLADIDAATVRLKHLAIRTISAFLDRHWLVHKIIATRFGTWKALAHHRTGWLDDFA